MTFFFTKSPVIATRLRETHFAEFHLQRDLSDQAVRVRHSTVYGLLVWIPLTRQALIRRHRLIRLEELDTVREVPET